MKMIRRLPPDFVAGGGTGPTAPRSTRRATTCCCATCMAARCSRTSPPGSTTRPPPCPPATTRWPAAGRRHRHQRQGRQLAGAADAGPGGGRRRGTRRRPAGGSAGQGLQAPDGAFDLGAEARWSRHPTKGRPMPVGRRCRRRRFPRLRRLKADRFRPVWLGDAGRLQSSWCWPAFLFGASLGLLSQALCLGRRGAAGPCCC